MTDAKNLDQKISRAYAGQLLWAVFDDSLSPADALRQYPTEAIGSDPSLDAAYQALWHMEADEAWQQSEVYYLDAQLTLIKMMAQTLIAGQDFPPELCNAYPRQGKILRHSEKQFWQNCWGWPWDGVSRGIVLAKRQWLSLFTIMRTILKNGLKKSR